MRSHKSCFCLFLQGFYPERMPNPLLSALLTLFSFVSVCKALWSTLAVLNVLQKYT